MLSDTIVRLLPRSRQSKREELKQSTHHRNQKTLANLLINKGFELTLVTSEGVEPSTA